MSAKEAVQMLSEMRSWWVENMEDETGEAVRRVIILLHSFAHGLFVSNSFKWPVFIAFLVTFDLSVTHIIRRWWLK